MMGVVWRAVDPDLGRQVALKTVQLAFAVTPQEAGLFEKRFLVEARAAARLSHPGIVIVHDVGRDAASGSLYIAFEHLQGRTLAEIMAAGQAMEWRQALRIATKVADALHHAHLQGLVHRDIKPANIMLLESGEPKIMDFGIAKLPTERLTSTGQFFGTPAYMSPEQASAEALDGRSDIFSLAAVLYLLLTGHTAFEGDSVPATLSGILFRDPPPVSQLVPGLPAVLDRVLARAMAKKPSDRPPDARAFALDLEEVLAGRVPLGLTDAPPRPESTQLSKAPLAPAEIEGGTPPRAEAGTVGPRPTHLRRREVFVVGLLGLVLVAVLLAAIGVRLPGLGTLGPTARVDVNFEHSLRSGVLRVFVDNDLALEEPLESRVKDDLVVIKVRKGRLNKSFDVRAGARALRLEVEGEGFRGTRTIEARFESGEARRLEVRLGGLIKKDLSAWIAPAKSS